MRARSFAAVLSLLLGCSGNNTTPVDAANPRDAVDAVVAEDLPGTDAPAPVDAPRTEGIAPEADAGVFAPVTLRETHALPGMSDEAQVVFTEGNVPHIYARNREDLARVLGFVTARDRYFMLDLARRLAQGTLSQLLGDAALDTDTESRSTGMTHATDRLLTTLDPEIGRVFDAYAAGINAYIARVRERDVPPPSELGIAAPLLGFTNPADAMAPFARRDIVAMGVTFLYQSGFETGDVGRQRAAERLPGEFTGQALAELRRAGVLGDIWNRLHQPARTSSARVQWGMESGDPMPSMLGPARPEGSQPVAAQRDLLAPPRALRVGPALLDGLSAALERVQRRLMRSREEGFGSNAWAVMGRHTRDGATLLAADGHLPLTIPTLFYQVGLDTRLLGGGDVHQAGLTLPLIPLLAMGTNGDVAWGFTQLAGDITDWYREEIQLGPDGVPRASRFNGEWRPLTRVEERFEVANVPALMSRGRTENFVRYVTFDGRFITAMEGRTVTASAPLGPNESRVMVLGGFVVPGRADGSREITGVSFDYVGLDPGDAFKAYDGFGRARTVDEYRRASRGLVATSLNQLAADRNGNVYYAGWQAVPCRGYLTRNPDRSWATGANPSLLLDGTRFGGFTIPVTNGLIDESQGAMDPYRCVVPQDRTPSARNPTRGFVQTANNEPGDITGDDDITSEPFYIGGPWNDGFRGARIEEVLGAGVTARNLDEAAMARLQADVRSPLGARLVPLLLTAIGRARTAGTATTPPPAGTFEARLAARWSSSRADYESVERRLQAWRDGGYLASSGVDTFYHTTDAADRAHSVATTIFNAWLGRFVQGVFGDERLPDGVWDNGGGSTARVRTLLLMLDGRGAGNSSRLASFNPMTNESAYFDVLGTEVVERSDEVMLTALDGALTFLRTAPTGPGAGGFGTADMDAWRWGLRHHVRFDSILASFLGNSSTLGPLVDGFSITPARIPLAMGLMAGDPRMNLPGFPRPGDQWVVDAANSGLDGSRFTFGSGATYRMVIALRSGGASATTGQNVVPGGQSALRNSPNFDDQARLWLGNRAVPLLLNPTAVIAAATGRERFVPQR